MKQQELVMQAPTLFGLEGLAKDEARYLGLCNVTAHDGGIEFTGTFEDMVRANVWLRTAERVQIVLSKFHAATFDELFEGTKEAPWENFIGSLDAFPVKGWSLKSQLHSVPDCQSIVKKAIVEHLKECYGISWFQETGSALQVQFSILNDEATLMLDTTGPGLYKRGYRRETVLAPIRETLAAGIVSLARVRSDSLVVDPCCGSGTLVLESAMKALNIAPGLKRNFSFEKWGCVPSQILPEVRKEAVSRIRKDPGFYGIGYDIDPKAVTASEENAKALSVGRYVRFQQADVRHFRADELPAQGHRRQIVLCNPPYGERLGDQQQARTLYRQMGAVFRPLENHSYFVISPDEEFETYFSRKADRRRKLYNGMLKCQLYMYFKESR